MGFSLPWFACAALVAPAAALAPSTRAFGVRMSAAPEPQSDRRAFGAGLLGAAAAALASNPGAAVADDAYALPPLPYA